jgi:hypothetical protein
MPPLSNISCHPRTEKQTYRTLGKGLGCIIAFTSQSDRSFKTNQHSPARPAAANQHQAPSPDHRLGCPSTGQINSIVAPVEEALTKSTIAVICAGRPSGGLVFDTSAKPFFAFIRHGGDNVPVAQNVRCPAPLSQNQPRCVPQSVA